MPYKSTRPKHFHHVVPKPVSFKHKDSKFLEASQDFGDMKHNKTEAEYVEFARARNKGLTKAQEKAVRKQFRHQKAHGVEHYMKGQRNEATVPRRNYSRGQHVVFKGGGVDDGKQGTIVENSMTNFEKAKESGAYAFRSEKDGYVMVKFDDGHYGQESKRSLQNVRREGEAHTYNHDGENHVINRPGVNHNVATTKKGEFARTTTSAEGERFVGKTRYESREEAQEAARNSGFKHQGVVRVATTKNVTAKEGRFYYSHHHEEIERSGNMVLAKQGDKYVVEDPYTATTYKTEREAKEHFNKNKKIDSEMKREPLVHHKEHLKTLEPFHKDDVDFHAPMKTAIIVPSTKNGSERVSKKEYAERVRETERFMSKEYGGFTAVEAHGGYVGDNGELITEPVTEVVAYTDRKTYQEKKPAVGGFLKEKRHAWTQQSMGYEQDKEAELYYFKDKER